MQTALHPDCRCQHANQQCEYSLPAQGHVINGSHQLMSGSQIIGDLVMAEHCHSEIEQFDDAGPRDHQIAGLDVAMDEVVGANVFETKSGLADDFAGVAQPDGIPVSRQLGDGDAINVLHHQKAESVNIVGGECSNDVRMVQTPDELHFPFKSVASLLVSQSTG